MGMKFAVCDDEPAQTEYLISLVKKWSGKKGVPVRIAPFDSAEAFRFAWSGDKSFDVLLLDIQMPGQSGMELAREIRRSDERLVIIFITGFAEYAEEGYDVGALHYLIKPVDEEKLFSVLDKAASRISGPARFLLLPGADGSIRVPADDIRYAEAFSHTVELYAARQTYALRITMNELEALAGEEFFRCHRSYLVNLKFVRRVTRKAMVLDSGREIPLSRKLYDPANQAFIRYC